MGIIYSGLVTTLEESAVVTHLFGTSNFICSRTHPPLLFSGLGPLFRLFILLFSRPILLKPYERCVAPLRNLKTEVLLHTTPEELKIKTHQSPAILDLFLRKTRSGKSHYYRDEFFFEKRRFQNVFKTFSSTRRRKAAFSNSSGLKIVFEMPRFS